MNADPNIKKLLERMLKDTQSLEHRKAEIAALRAMAETYPGTESSKMYSYLADELEKTITK